MEKEKQIKDMAKIIARRAKAFRDPKVAFMTTAEKTAAALYYADYRKQSNATPCDNCRFNPPSSGDNKPCSVCPAQAKQN